MNLVASLVHGIVADLKVLAVSTVPLFSECKNTIAVVSLMRGHGRPHPLDTNIRIQQSMS